MSRAPVNLSPAAGAVASIRAAPTTRPPQSRDDEHVSLCEALDRLLNKGVVVKGELTISVANIDLIYLGLQVLLASVETARHGGPAPTAPRTDQATRTR
jgi:hypothetical protein